MVCFKVASVAVALASVLCPSVFAEVDPIVIKGSKFFYKTNGTQFFMRGIAYQQDVGGPGTTTTNSKTTSGNVNFIDPLTDEAGCKRDIPNLVALRTNAIRVYAIDTTKDHSKCMSMLQDAGIYLIADLSAPNISINRDSPSWDAELYTRYTSVIDTLAPYSNVLGFFAGNEVSNNVKNVDSIAFVKAAVRDTKSYIKQKNYREMYVGYAADDDANVRGPLRNYINCGSVSVDFFGYNIYSWCGKSGFKESGYDERTKEFANYTVPTFFAEYGCIDPLPRSWYETIALYSDKMTDVWSGGIAYEYFQAERKYGLVALNGGTASKLPDFTRLASQIAKVTPSGVKMDSYQVTNTVARSCPPTGASWKAVASPLPPSPNAQLCSCMVKSLTCVPKDSVKPDDYESLFSAACETAGICDGVGRNGSTGKYGAYSMCDARQQLSWALNSYYQDQITNNQQNNNPCDFAGNATTQTPVSATAGACASLMSQAGAAGTGVVTSAPTGGASGDGAATSSGVAGAVTIPSFDFVFIKIGLYVTVAAMVGAGMVLL